jgi:glycosyltransferase involved in cell wall biosynthesis
MTSIQSSPSPRVTLGMPSYNRAGVVGESIRGVLAQTYQDFEFIIYDDGSKDDSINVIRSFADHRISVVAAENKGPPHPLVEILKRARGEFLIILHDHDIFSPTLLEKSVKALDEYPSAGFVLQGGAWVGEDGKTGYREMLLDWPRFNPGPDCLRELLLRPERLDSPFHACAMIRMSAWKQVGLHYDIVSGWYADVELTFRLLAKHDFVYLREVLFTFREREQGHVLGKRTWQTYATMETIHAAAIERVFPATDPRRAVAVNALRHKLGVNRRRALLGLATVGDETQVEQGWHYLRNPAAPLWAKFLGWCGETVPSLKTGFIHFAMLARRCRQLCRR